MDTAVLAVVDLFVANGKDPAINCASDETVINDKLPEPSVDKSCPEDPSAFGNLIPSKFILPEPFGVIFRGQ